MTIEDYYAGWQISPEIVALASQTEEKVQSQFRKIEGTRTLNQLKVLKALQEAKLAESDLGGSSGYGYDDRGRERLETAFAKAMGAEKALVRWQISSGTHALALCLFGILRPGDEVLSVAGEVYDTMQPVMGRGMDGLDQGTLADFGITYRVLPLKGDGVDYAALAETITPETKMIWIQRSRGYKNRPALRIEEIGKIVKVCREVREDLVVVADNCYGEFTEDREPCEVGVDLVAGSLIKNPGGGIAQTGGYVAGRADLVEKAAQRLTAPGVGSEIGPTLGFTRQMAQGFYQAPHVVGECLKGLVFTSALLQELGYETSPGPFDPRSDIVQVLRFKTADELVAFCKSIQASSPVDSFVSPVPGPMPGYDSPVIMAAGAFVQGSSMELSADGPLREPYQAFMQGGIVYDNIKLAAMAAAEAMRRRE